MKHAVTNYACTYHNMWQQNDSVHGYGLTWNIPMHSIHVHLYQYSRYHISDMHCLIGSLWLKVMTIMGDRTSI